jgi:WD40 repeat protein
MLKATICGAAILLALALMDVSGARLYHGMAAPALAASRTPAPVYDVAWSPSGTQIAWDDRRHFWVANANGSHAHVFARPADRDCCGSLWWPRPKVLVYEDDFRVFRVTTGGHTSAPVSVLGGFLWVDRHGTVGATESPRGPSALQLVGLRVPPWTRGVKRGGRPVLDLNPTFSPNGREVAFARFFCQSEDGDCSEAGIWKADVRTGETTQLLSEGTCPSWSPDGKQLLFVDASGAFRIVTFGSEQTTLLLENVVGSQPYEGPCALAGIAPLWSSDSRYIAFLSGTHDLALKVLLVSDPTRVRSFSQLGKMDHYAWSPTSDTLLAIGMSSGSRRFCSLWSIDAETGKTRALKRCR